MSSTKPKVLSIGISTLDTIATIDSFPNPDDKLRSSSLVHAGGGNAANTAFCIARLGQVGVDLVTSIGKDGHGEVMMKELRDEKVGVDETVERYEGNSAWSYIMVMKGTRTIIHQPQTKELSLPFVNKIMVERYVAAHFDGRHPKAAVYLSKQCQKKGVPYSVDVERPREGLLEILGGASFIICNSKYCDLVLGENPNATKEDIIVERLRRVFNEQSPRAKFVVMTMGDRGSCLVPLCQTLDEYNLTKEGRIVLGNANDDSAVNVVEKCGALWCDPMKNCHVADTTGAGDIFQGALLSALWISQRPKDCASIQVPTNKMLLAHSLQIASTVAGKKVAKGGAREGIPSADDEKIMSSFSCIKTSELMDF